jgi:nucleoside-diphosphate-sugar epimerase
MLREDAAPACCFLNAYAESKAAAETLVRVRGSHIILRPHAIYGPGDHVLLPRLLDALVCGRLIAVGDGRNMISLTHVDNLVDALMLALAASITGSARGVFNIADAKPLRLDEVLNAVLTATGHRPRIHYLPKNPAWFIGAVLETLWRALGRRKAPRLTPYRVAQVADEYTLDWGKAAAVLGYAPTRNLFDYLAVAYGWSAPVAARRTSSTS